MAHDVFLSYEKTDKRVAEAACRALEASGVRVWIAPRDIDAGATWAQAVSEAIDGARLIVLIFSKASNSSDYVRKEINGAVDRKRPIIPFRIENVIPSGALGIYLGDVQWLDGFPPPDEPHLKHLVARVRKALGMMAQAAAISKRPATAKPGAEPRPAMPKASPLIISAASPKSFPGRPAAIAASILAVLTATGLYVFLSRRQPVAPVPPLDKPVATIANVIPQPVPQKPLGCKNLGLACPDDEDAAAVWLPGQEITGKPKVLSASTLEIKDTKIELVNVAPAPASSAKKLQDWIEGYNTARCIPAPRVPKKFFCDVGPEHLDLSELVTSRGWAERAPDTPLARPPKY